jgi:hypothetical protein
MIRRAQHKEGPLKAWVLNRLLDQGRIDRSTVLASEYSLPTEELRADLALLADEFIGVEVKGPLDSLRRLPRQLQSYARIFDRTILVCSSAHICHVLGRVPRVELWEVTKNFDLVIHQQPCVSTIWSADRAALARAVTCRRRLIGSFEVDPRESLTESFRDKFCEPSRRFWQAVSRRAPTADDLAHLSRFIEQRSAYRQSQNYRKTFWAAWQEQAVEYFK